MPQIVCVDVDGVRGVLGACAGWVDEGPFTIDPCAAHRESMPG